ncbi:hypothetical protein MUP65_02970 [Patescibacteria group bacterium]|nr:hypothetical protein [Patescibacteria group bacterium]
MELRMVKRIGFDLDGVLIDKPPLMPRWLLHWLFKGSSKKLNYCCPTCGWNRWLRVWSHQPWLRPPIVENISFLRELAAKKGVKLYLISSRYSFLKKATQKILRKRGIETLFDEIVLNEKDQPSHLFKEEALRRLKVQVYFEDDIEVIGYLRKVLPGLEVSQISPSCPCMRFSADFEKKSKAKE